MCEWHPQQHGCLLIFISVLLSNFLKALILLFITVNGFLTVSVLDTERII